MINSIINGLINSLSYNISNYQLREKVNEEVKKFTSAQYEKLRLTKNALFKNEPTDFYQSYVPLTLKQNQRGHFNDSSFVRVNDPSSFLEEFKKSIILGSAGSGKTTLLRFITLKCIEEGIAIPILIELRHFKSTRLSFEDFIASQISLEYIPYIKQLFEQGKFVFLFDGFDEINYKEGEAFINDLESFITKNYQNSFVISSRPGTNIENLSQFFVFEINPLNENDIYIFVDKFNLRNKTKEKVLESLNKDDYLKKYLSIPLFLSVYIQYVENNIDVEVPERKSIFFRRIVDSLFSKHDSVTKLGFVREKLSGLSKDELESVSSILAFRAFVSSKFEFSKDELYNEFEIIKRTKKIKFDNEKLAFDLTITINILVESGDYFFFQHILLLEYLASLFIAKLDKRTKEGFYKRFVDNPRIYLSPSFLNLLLELDRFYFLKYFLYPTLEVMLVGSDNPRNRFVVEEFLRSSFNQFFTYYNQRVNTSTIENIMNSVADELNNNIENNLGELFNF